MKISDLTQERSDGPTPNGGAYAIAYWLDVNGQPIEKHKAKRAEVVEFSEDGEQIFRTYAVLGNFEPDQGEVDITV